MNNQLIILFQANKAFFASIVRNGKSILLLQLILIILNTFVSYITVISPKMFIDCVVEEKDLISGMMWILIMLFSGVFLSLFSSFLSIRKSNIYEKAKLAAKEVFVKKMSFFYLSFFDDPNNQNEFQRALNYNETGGMAALDTIVSTISTLASLSTVAYISLRFDWWIWIAIIALFVFRIATVPIIRNANFKFNAEQVPRNRKISYFSSIILGAQYITDIRIFNSLPFFMKKYKNEVESNIIINQKFSYRMAIKQLLLSLPSKCFDIFLYVVIGIKLLTQEVTLGDYTLFFSMIASINGALNSISMSYSSISTQTQNAKILYDFLNRQDNVMALPEACHRIDKVETIELEEVSFRYSGQDGDAISKLSLNISKGEKIAIVGYNGAGKTTLVKLLLMQYKPKSGNIRINKIDINDIDMRSFWDQCSVLQQNHNEYAITIAENVLLDECHNDKRSKVKEALHKAGLNDKIKGIKNGINVPFTRLFYEGGVEFSGGERQKLAIARLIAKDASLIIMDEPSSSLDPSYEDQLNDYIGSISKEKTVIVISHRLSSVMACDRVILMRNGGIIADGTHKELYSTCEEYKRLYDKQKEKYTS
ncbi:MAG: ABC transporter ATP-binding protein [Clostridia bacterium]|nr:ABC transporter ATP-binding protein [Clostridia bacterium]